MNGFCDQQLATAKDYLALGNLIRVCCGDEKNINWNNCCFYRPQRSWAKVMFLQVCVCPQGERVSASVHAGMPDPPGPGRHPPPDQADTPPDQADPHPDQADTPQTRQTPPLPPKSRL